ncbi:MAG: PucR family transcriptional regulator [Sciscionella sp.]
MASAPGCVSHPPAEVTLRAIAHASGEFATAVTEAMERQLSWFSRMPAEQRAEVALIVQASVAGFVEWCHNPQTALRLTADTFRSAPRDLSRWVSLRQTVELVRVALEVFEQRVPLVATAELERSRVAAAVLRYGREVAFAAATSYATAAEARGAWDARLEALVVDGIVRGDAEESLLSRAAALGWDQGAAATVLVGNSPSDDPPQVVFEVRARAARASRSVLLSVQGSRLIVLLAGPTETRADAHAVELMSSAFGRGPVVAGPTTAGLAEAYRSAAEALSGYRAVVAWPGAPRPVRSTELLPERALAGDPEAERQLVEEIAGPLTEGGGELLATVEAYLASGGVLEACARELYVHPNTVRYRLRKARELTGRNATDPRDAFVLRIALAVGLLAKSRGLW